MAQVQHQIFSPPVQPFSFKWTIEHFSIAQEQEKLVSDPFIIDGPKPTKWQLHLLPKGSADYLSLYLAHIPEKETVRVKASFYLEIQSSTHDHYSLGKTLSHVFSKSSSFGWGYARFIYSDVLKLRMSDLIPNDVMTVTCKGKMMLKEEEIIEVQGPTIADDMRRMLESNAGKDVKLDASDCKGEIYAHKFILKARSPVFAAMLQPKTPETRLGRIFAHDFTTEVVQGLLHFMYTNEAPEGMTDEQAYDLMKAANTYKVPGLHSLCKRHLAEKI